MEMDPAVSGPVSNPYSPVFLTALSNKYIHYRYTNM